MFRVLGRVISRGWPVCLASWIALVVALRLTAPPWQDVAQDREYGFLPEDAPSRQGEAFLKQAFPTDVHASTVVIVLRRELGKLTREDRKFVRHHLKPGLQQIADQSGIITTIRTLHDPGSGLLLVSEDRQATLVVIELTTELLEYRNWAILEKIENLIERLRQDSQVPAGLEITLTGSATVGRDITRGQVDSARATEFWTIVLVIVLLGIIFRAPLLAVVPLLSLYAAITVSLQLLAHLAQAGYVTLFEGIQTYTTVIMYGAGVDYCLFLIARYREELADGASPRDAVANAVGKVGAALTASAATVICGIGMLYFAEFGKLHHAGIAIAFSLAIALLAVLSFTPALLRLTGSWAFWPISQANAQPREEKWWIALSEALGRHPGLIWLSTVLLMTPLVAIGVTFADHVDYDLIRRLPADAPSAVGARALQKHFGAGIAGPVTVLVSHPDIDFQSADGRRYIESLTDRLKQEKDKLRLSDVRSLTSPLGITRRPREALLEVPVLGELLEEAMRQKALDYYVSSAGPMKGHATRVQLVMQENPLSRKGINQLDEIEAVVREELSHGPSRDVQLFFTGASASGRDLRMVIRGDEVRVQVLVIVCVLGILLVLVRRPVISVYLLLSVLFSYFATLGLTQTFWWAIDPGGFAGLDWKTPLFLFTILVAIGEDYNIFLITRTTEEQQATDNITGVQRAVVKTGRIITCCGIIMAGTFASLIAGSLQDLQQLGFALVCGVLIDTFVVRPILVPSFMILLYRATGSRQPFSSGVSDQMKADGSLGKSLSS